jgi:glyoxylate/hydroxypyruvate reductase A
MLDVFSREPLPEGARFGASASGDDAACCRSHPSSGSHAYIAKTIRLERGETVSGQVDRQRGY